MKILNKSTTPNGIPFQLEDWSEVYSCFSYGSTLAAYPEKYGQIRCECNFKNNSEALKAFEKLSQGLVTIFDYDFTVMLPGGNRISVKEHIDMNKFNQFYNT